jgi:hypothetical protein
VGARVGCRFICHDLRGRRPVAFQDDDLIVGQALTGHPSSKFGKDRLGGDVVGEIRPLDRQPGPGQGVTFPPRRANVP